MLAIITSILPLALRVVDIYLDKSQADRETQEAFLRFTELAAKSFTSSAALKKSYDDQKARMDAIEAKAAEAKKGQP